MLNQMNAIRCLSRSKFSNHSVPVHVDNGDAAQSSDGGNVWQVEPALVKWWECAAIDKFGGRRLVFSQCSEYSVRCLLKSSCQWLVPFIPSLTFLGPIMQELITFFYRTTGLILFRTLTLTAAQTLLDALHTSVLHYVPSVKFFPSKFPAWFSKYLIDLVFKKKKAHVVFQNTKNPDDNQSFSILRAQYKYMSKQCYRSLITTIKSYFNSNPSKFWEFIKKNRSN